MPVRWPDERSGAAGEASPEGAESGGHSSGLPQPGDLPGPIPCQRGRIALGSRPGKDTELLDQLLHRVRRRQRSLTRAVLALVCLAWLQAAVLPCAMAGGGAAAATPAVHHCPYCPPGGSSPPASDHGGDCAYPHGPQVDARPSALFVAIPTSMSVVVPVAVAHDIHVSEATLPEPVPRVPIALSFCRLIE